MDAIADLALLRGTGARGLRAILEDVLRAVMFDLPGRTDIGRCVIDVDTVMEKVTTDVDPTRRRPLRAAAPRCFLSSQANRLFDYIDAARRISTSGPATNERAE